MYYRRRKHNEDFLLRTLRNLGIEKLKEKMKLLEKEYSYWKLRKHKTNMSRIYGYKCKVQKVLKEKGVSINIDI